MIGSLMYLLKTRHDIRKEVQYLASRSNAPAISDRLKVYRVLAYLNQTPTLAARYYSAKSPELFIYADASYGTHIDGRSQTGYFISVGEGSAHVFCYAGKQKSCVATGSMEAEYVALTKAAKKLIHLRLLLSELGFPQNSPSIAFEDNKSAIDLANAPELTKNSKHIAIRHHYIRDLVQTKQVTIRYIPTAQQTADLLTKPITSKPLFLYLRGRLLNSREPLPAPIAASMTRGEQHLHPHSKSRGEC